VSEIFTLFGEPRRAAEQSYRAENYAIIAIVGRTQSRKTVSEIFTLSAEPRPAAEQATLLKLRHIAIVGPHAEPENGVANLYTFG
jgi:hypothetical protein